MTAEQVSLALYVFVQGDLRLRDALIDLLVTNDSPREVAHRHEVSHQKLYEKRAKFLPLVRDGSQNVPDMSRFAVGFEDEGVWE